MHQVHRVPCGLSPPPLPREKGEQHAQWVMGLEMPSPTPPSGWDFQELSSLHARCASRDTRPQGIPRFPPPPASAHTFSLLSPGSNQIHSSTSGFQHQHQKRPLDLPPPSSYVLVSLVLLLDLPRVISASCLHLCLSLPSLGSPLVSLSSSTFQMPPTPGSR